MLIKHKEIDASMELRHKAVPHNLKKKKDQGLINVEN